MNIHTHTHKILLLNQKRMNEKYLYKMQVATLESTASVFRTIAITAAYVSRIHVSQ